jgi:hypothetical protein
MEPFESRQQRLVFVDSKLLFAKRSLMMLVDAPSVINQNKWQNAHAINSTTDTCK